MSDKPTKVVGRRVVAFIIDGIVATAINSVIFFALAEKQSSIVLGDDVTANTTLYGNLTLGDNTYSVYGSKAGLYFALTLAIGLAYWVILPGLKGFTLGKAMLGLRIIKDDGTCPPGIGRSFARQFLFIADAFPYIIPYLTGFIVAMTNKDNKRIGDLVANTMVVKKEAVGSAGAEGLAPTWLEGTAAPPPAS